MLCLSCTMPSGGHLCEACRFALRPTPEVTIGPGLIGIGGFVHEGPARRLVHSLKYRAVMAAAEPLADEMARRVPGSVSALIPMPRAVPRAVRHGVDPSAVLAAAVSRRTGLDVIEALRPPWWRRRHAGRRRAERIGMSFGRTGASVPAHAALVDDVLTTGATARAASTALGGAANFVLVATRASMMGPGDDPSGGAVAVKPSRSPTRRTNLRARTPDTAVSARSGMPNRGRDRNREEHE